MTITNANFEDEVLRSEIPVLLDFWAAWCGPCRMLAPVLEEIEQEYAGRIKVGKVNVDEEIELAQRYRVASIPTVILFKEGQAAEISVGYRPKEDFEAMIKSVI